MSARPDVILLAGPTASGKSTLAMRIAEQTGGTVVNADSMQVYEELRILTARPSEQDEERVPHTLYGHVSAADDYSVASWIEDLRSVLVRHDRTSGPLIVCGGTGLYFKAAIEGLSAIPEIDPEVRASVRAKLLAEGSPELWKQLDALDAEMASRLLPNDGHRVARALEVALATGRSLAWWRARPKSEPVLSDFAVRRYLLVPKAEQTRSLIAARATAVLSDEGLAAEIEALRALAVSREKPAGRAIGVDIARNLLGGRISLRHAVDQLTVETARYAKRQRTWFRNQFADWHSLPDGSLKDAVSIEL